MAAALEALGWTRTSARPATPPLLEGEPELAGFRKDETHLAYSFNPVVMLRALSLRGADASAERAALAAHFACLGPEEIRALLADTEPEQQLLGILAAGEVGDLSLSEPLQKLQTNPDQRLAKAARHAFQALSLRLVQQGAEALAREQKRRPERSALFPRLGDAHLRRQTLRWLIPAGKRNDHVLATLRAALDDADWEVRLTAMLAAARLGASELIPVIRQLSLPRTTREGLVADDRSILVALRKAAVEHLAGMPIPDAKGARRAKALIWARLRGLVAGKFVAPHDRAFLLVHALTEPLPEETPEPESLPPAIVADGEGYRLRKSGIPLCWAPPIAHWLGADEPDLDNPPRRLAPPRGFFVTRFPISAARAAELEGAGPDDGDPHTLTWEEARAWCARLSNLEGVNASLPTSDQWEIAARGPDGRRHPWGNGVEPGFESLPSPWGVAAAVSGPPEWTLTPAQRGHALVRGGDKLLRCAFMRPLAGTEKAAFRPIVPLDSK